VSSFLASFAESWRDAVRDVLLIVVSIVIAFAVDAWWEELGERRQERGHLEALLAEFSVVRAGLDTQLAQIERSRQATEQILRLTGPSPSDVSADSLARLINDSFNIGAFPSSGGSPAGTSCVWSPHSDSERLPLGPIGCVAESSRA